MTGHDGTDTTKFDLHINKATGGDTAHVCLEKKSVADLVERGRITIVGSDCNLTWNDGDQPHKVRYITIDVV